MKAIRVIPPSAFNLTLEQSLQMRMIRDQIPLAKREDLELMFIELSKILMVKDNIVRALIMSDIEKGL